MGKVRKVTLGDEGLEKEQKRRAEARRETKKSKKTDTDTSDVTKAEVESVAKTEEEKDIKKRHMRKGKGKARSEKYLKAKKMIDIKKLYTVSEAVKLVKETSYSKFDGTVELHAFLNVDIKEKTKLVRGEVNLPHGTGKERKVTIASDETISKLEKGIIDFDVLIAEPTMMPKLAKFARLLGPKGLMPNPKAGTVTADPAKKIKELQGGKMNFKSEPENPIVHLPVGKVSFDEKKLMENIEAVLVSFGVGKVKKASIAATMGPGIRLAV
jgi:large subunit ribosomal protein L1